MSNRRKSNRRTELSRNGLVSIVQNGWQQAVGPLRRHFGRRAAGWGWRRLGIEPLEERALPTVSLEGIPLWIEQGPGTITHGNSEGIPNPGFNDGSIAGPQAGAVNVVAPVPTNPSRVYAGSVNGGIWKTEDGSTANPHWTPLTDQFPSLSISSLAFSPLDPSYETLFAGTAATSSGGGDGGPAIGLLKTTDGGDTWSVLGGPVNGSGNKYSISYVIPTAIGLPATQVVLVSTSAGVFRSTDGGVTFDTSPVLSGKVTHLVADPANAGRFFAAIPGQGVFRSTNEGQDWDVVLSPTFSVGGFGADYDALSISIHYNAGAGTNVIYVAGFFDPEGDSNDDDDVVVLRSDEPGADIIKWTLMDLPPRLGIPRRASIAAHPTDENLVFLGSVKGENLGNCQLSDSRTSRGDASEALGSQWESVVCDGASGTAPHADSRGLYFDAAGNLIETTDGGIYRLHNPTGDDGSERFWESMSGDLRTAEFYSVAYDSLNHSLFGGTQDNGTPQQLSPGTPGGEPEGFTWRQRRGGDGAIVQIDTSNENCEMVFPCSIHYQSAQTLGSFTREEYNSLNGPVMSTAIALEVDDSEGRTLTEGQNTKDDPSDDFDPNVQFIQAWALNAADPMRLLIGTDYLYESFDQGDHLTALGGLDDEFSPINPVGRVNRTAGSGTEASPIAYGGWLGDEPYADVLWIGAMQGLDSIDNDGDGDIDESNELTPTLRLRASGSGLPDIVANYPGAQVQDIALDPTDWRRAYILDLTGRVFEATTNNDGSSTTFTELTGDLATFATDVRTIEFMRADVNTPVLLVGGQGGVYRAIDPSSSSAWSELGFNLPNAPVNDLHFNATDNVLVAGTFGRGAWTIPLASLKLFESPAVEFCGTDNADLLVLDTNDGNPLLLDFVLNGVREASLPYSALKSVHVCGRDGDDVILTQDMKPWISLTVDGDAGRDTIGFTDLVTIPVYVNGGSGDDIIGGTSASDILNGDSGDDEIIGLGGDDSIDGGSDDDTIFGGPGSDTLHGGDGHDLLVGGSGTDSLSGGDGSDQLIGGIQIASLDEPNSDASPDTLSGGVGDDGIIADDGSFLPLVIRVTSGGNDIVRGGDGNDVIFGGAGSDNIQGQGGDDTIAAGPGNDTVIGGWLLVLGMPPQADGDDVISGGDGADVVYGDNFDPLLPPSFSLLGGNDQLLGGDGNDTIYGQTGHDELDGGRDDDTLHGGLGNDEVSGGPGADSLVGDIGIDLMFGDEGPDTLDGGADNDSLVGGSGDDELRGGLGDDLLTGENGDDLLVGGFGSDTLDGGAGNDELIGGNLGGAGVQADFSDDSLNGGDGDDVLLGDSGSINPFFIPALDILGGNDSIQGGSGHDTIYGQAGDDFIGGGPGNDLIYCGVNNDIAGGDEGIDVVEGQAGNDVLAGGEGNDTVRGGSGDDILVGGFFSAGAIVVAETGDDLLEGGDGDDTLFGDSWALGAPFSFGVVGGQDIVWGGAGNDLAVGQSGNDLLFGDAGNDTLLGANGNDRIRGSDGDDQLDGGTGHDVLLGEGGDDSLTGGDGRDVLIGGLDADTLDGGADDDILIAGTTAFDADSAALNLILAEWTSARSYLSRVKNLKGIGNGNPAFDNRLNGTVFLKKNGPAATVFDDNASDPLTGSSGDDWFLFDQVLDELVDWVAGETKN